MTNVKPHGRRNLAPHVGEVARSLHHFLDPAFLTDPCNRIIAVNRSFAQTFGDPVRDGIDLDERFVPALIVGAYRDRFPDGPRDVAACVASFGGEVDAGQLAQPTLRLASRLLDNPEIRRLSELGPWNGILVARDLRGQLLALREQVLSIAGPTGDPTSFHLSIWSNGESPEKQGVEALLTARQLQIARLFATGLSSTQVAEAAGIARSTARDHLEQIYSRLGVHSRAELATLLTRERLI